MELSSIWLQLVQQFHLLADQLTATVLTPANLVQTPAVILTGLVAWLICRPLQRMLAARVLTMAEDHQWAWVLSHRGWVADRLIPLITPAAWTR